MALNPARITAINTALNGINGAPGQSAGASGGTPPDASETFTGDSFNDPSASLNLYPTVTGGYGGDGAQGKDGANGVATINGPTTEWSDGQPGATGGNGAAGAAASVTMDDEAIGSLTTRYGGSVAIRLQSTAGAGGTGGAGGNGGNSGYTTPTSEGGAGGSGGSGGSGAAGGAASAVLDSITANTSQTAVYSVSATGGAGGSTPGISGFFGSPGGLASDGGNGGNGGNAGSATATISNSTLYDTQSISLLASATGGRGGDGGSGGAGGPGVNEGNPVTTYRGGVNGNGGNGGNGGDAYANITHNFVDSPYLQISARAFVGAGGAAGTGGVEGGISTPTTTYINNPPGADGVAGQYGDDPLTLTDNQFILGSGIPGTPVSAQASTRLTLTLSEEELPGENGTPPGGAVPLDGAAGGNLVFSGNVFTGTGTSVFDLEVQGGGVTADTLDGTISIGGSSANMMTGFNTFYLDAGDTFVAGTGRYTLYDTAGAAPTTIVYTPTSGATTVYDGGFGASLDTLAQLQADTSVSGYYTYIDLPGGGELTISSAVFAASAADISFAPLCFCAGTRIATSRGEIAVEALAIGDCVTTLHRGARSIKWIGRRSYDARFIAGQKLMMPVCLKPDAIAPGVPVRDLWVSPGHAIHIDGALVPAWLLVNGVSIIQAMPADRVTYLHIELDDHDIIVAEGCPTETYLDEGRRGQFQNAAEFTRLYPGAADGPQSPCLSRLESGFHLQAIQRRLAAQAGLTPPPVKHGPLRGFVDQAGPDMVSGWAQDDAQPEIPVCLDILVDGRRVQCVLANLYRDDLRQAGIGSGKHSFQYRSPPGTAGQVDVRGCFGTKSA
jgi:hypothetical protein